MVWLVLLSRSFLICDELMDMTLGNGHAAVTDLYAIPVDDFVETVVWRKVLADKPEEFLVYTRGDMVAKW